MRTPLLLVAALLLALGCADEPNTSPDADGSGQTIPGPWDIDENDVEYFPKGSDFEAAREAAQLEAYEARGIIHQVSTFYAALDSFAVTVTTTLRIEAPGIDVDSTDHILLRRQHPQRLAILPQAPATANTIVSDGQQLTIYLPDFNRYTTAPAPATIAELRDEPTVSAASLAGGAGALSFVAFYADDLAAALLEDVTTAEYLGTENLATSSGNTVPCHHCRLVTDESDWDVWIAAGDQPLIYRIAANMSRSFQALDEDAADPDPVTAHMSATFTEWRLDPSFTDDEFSFTPPADARRDVSPPPIAE